MPQRRLHKNDEVEQENKFDIGGIPLIEGEAIVAIMPPQQQGNSNDNKMSDVFLYPSLCFFVKASKPFNPIVTDMSGV